MDSQEDSADPDRRDDDRGYDREPGVPSAARGRQENEEDRAVAHDGPERVSARKAVPWRVRDGVRDHRAQPADQRLHDRIDYQRADACDDQVGGQPPAAPEREQRTRSRDNR